MSLSRALSEMKDVRRDTLSPLFSCSICDGQNYWQKGSLWFWASFGHLLGIFWGRFCCWRVERVLFWEAPLIFQIRLLGIILWIGQTDSLGWSPWSWSHHQTDKQPYWLCASLNPHHWRVTFDNCYDCENVSDQRAWTNISAAFLPAWIRVPVTAHNLQCKL